MTRISILHLEDDQNDSELIQDEFKSSRFKYDYTRVDCEKDFIAQLNEKKYDIILADYHLPKFSGILGLKYRNEYYPEIPFIFVTGALGDEKAVNLFKYGATEYVLKQNLKRLIPAIEHCLEEYRLKQEKLRAEAELQETNSFNASLLMTIPLGMHIIDEEGTILFLNDHFKNNFGPVSIGIKCWNACREDQKQPENCPLRKGIKIDKTDSFEGYNMLGNRIFDISATGIMFQGKKALLEVFRDVTLRKQAEEKIKISEDRLNEAQRIAHVGSWELDLRTKKLEWSDEVYRIFEIKKENGECSYDKFISMIHPRDKELVDRSFTDSVHYKLPYVVVHRILLPNERIKFVEERCETYYDNEGKPVRSLGTIQDITDRKQAENELRKLSRAVEQSPASIVITNPEGKIEYVNAKFTKLTGYTRAEVMGKNPNILKSGEMSKESYKNLWDTILAGKEWFGEFHNKKKNGELYWELASISPIFDFYGSITHFLAVKEDITLNKKSEAELIRAKEKAEESDRLKTAFLHNISHEVRTPMNAITGFTALLENPNLSPETRISYVQTIREGTNQLLSIIDDLVDISSIEANIIKINQSTFNINDTLVSLHKQYQLKSIENNNTLKINIGLKNDDAVIQTDNRKLIQILSNLITNALKFTKSGTVEFGYRLKDQEIEFFVSDTGIGIAEENFTRIFESFYQVDSALTRQFGGTGLGLTISKAYVELLGGKIWVISKVGKGSVFYFTIPNTIQKESFKSHTGQEKPERIPEPCTILVAEDDDINYKVMVILLSRHNVRVLRARNGKEAVELCRNQPNIDLVLMDLKMPVMDGYSATKIIKGFRPDLPVIAQTAYITDKDSATGFGCSDFISKPFKESELVSVIRRHLNTKDSISKMPAL